MKASEFDYELLEELIADRPVAVRDQSRLMVVRGGDEAPEHRLFRDLPSLLRAGDLLVMNDARVIPARLLGHREPGGGACEALLLSPLPSSDDGHPRWTAMVRPGKKLRAGAVMRFSEELSAVVEDVREDGDRVLRFDCKGEEFRALLDRAGVMPLPPYILARRADHAAHDEDRERYQTVYARAEGSVAAPTAGLHFTPELLAKLHDMGVERAAITLHVGAGTFKPISAENVEDHDIHEESFDIPVPAATAINLAVKEGRRVIAVGTTTVRTLESACDDKGFVRVGSGATRLMILPGYRFKTVSGLVTNFHLPRSTLLCLVAAMTGHERLMQLYAEAIRQRYRFYSYGDAMFVAGG